MKLLLLFLQSAFSVKLEMEEIISGCGNDQLILEIFLLDKNKSKLRIVENDVWLNMMFIIYKSKSTIFSESEIQTQ